MDEHTREALAIPVERRIEAAATVAVLDRLVAERPTAPRFLRYLEWDARTASENWHIASGGRGLVAYLQDSIVTQEGQAP